MELTPDWPSASRIRQPRLSVISLLRVLLHPRPTEPFMHPRERERWMDREGKGSGGQNNFALSANLSRSRVRLSFYVHLPPPPLLPLSILLARLLLFILFPSYLRPRLRSSLNKRPPAMLHDSDVRFILVPSPSSPLTSLAYLAFSAEFQITGRSSFFSLFVSSLFGLRLLRMAGRVYYLLMLRGNVARQRDQDERFENLFQYIVV